MKVVTIVGARPQFIKAAVVSRLLRKTQEEVLLHTGQHFDYNMSEVFFDEMDIPKPEYNLCISGGSHGRMTGEMLLRIEEVLVKEKPALVLVYGDTNSTLAGALAAVKLRIPVCHIESGVRLGTLRNPEEVNRICTDHISSLLMCCTPSSVEFLEREGVKQGVHLVGDPMYDAFAYYSERLSARDKENIIGLDGKKLVRPEAYYYFTCHREENTTNDETIVELMSAMNSLDAPTIYPVHPRNRARVMMLWERGDFKNIKLTQPVGYLTSISLLGDAKRVVTDSGGLQREAFFAGVPCVTVFDYIAWPETMAGNMNQLSRPDREEILSKLAVATERDESYHPFGDANAAEKIVSIIAMYLSEKGERR